MSVDYDIVIAGGGFVGTVLATALAHTNWRVCLIDAVDETRQKKTDIRGIALSLSSCRILTRLGIFPCLERVSYPIKKIHISEQGSFGVVKLSAAEFESDVLGYVVIASDLARAVYQQLSDRGGVDVLRPAQVTAATRVHNLMQIDVQIAEESTRITSRLLVIADGTESKIRSHMGIDVVRQDYHQIAVVSGVIFAGVPPYCAFERFTEQGPVALLPISKERGVAVLTVPQALSEYYRNMDVDTFSSCIHAAWGSRFDSVTATGVRRMHPLCYLAAKDRYQAGLVLLGNAACTLHPNAAQGLNLGLRDAAMLAEVLTKTDEKKTSPGDISLLRSYATRQLSDQQRIVRFTRMLARLFYSDARSKRFLRHQAMLTIAYTPCLRRSLVRLLTGLFGDLPDLAKEEM